MAAAALLAAGAIGTAIGTHTRFHLFLFPALACDLAALTLLIRRRLHR